MSASTRALGAQLGLDERATLRLLLAALEEGLVTLNWELRCPACGATNHRGDSLIALHGEARCGACHGRFAPQLDGEVHVTFSVHGRVRALGRGADAPVYRAEVDARLGVVSGHALGQCRCRAFTDLTVAGRSGPITLRSVRE
ncbi:MAG TPA: DUF5939 domain-containing protein [Chloroflexaceae bacterium]|nr:DUF5939 domain-containing protein [Chloroflexaceae bacterium]